jgi:Protein of unknown function (DUF2442)
MDALLKNLRKENLFVEDIRFEDHRMIISFLNGTELPVPLAWFPKLYYATPRQLSQWNVIANGKSIRWPELDESLALNELIH